MAAAKTERLMNLLIMLLVQRGFVTKARIRELIYPDSSDEAFDRMFERDKDELRSLGVPIETGPVDELFDDEYGYRVSAASYALPEIELTAEEAAVVGVATKVWEHASLAEATSEAVRKLRAAGHEVDATALEIARPRLAVEESSFDVFLEAVQSRREVRFRYRRPGEEEAGERRLQPWGVLRTSGRWYVVGFDLVRRAERVFRLSRVVGEAVLTGPEGAYDIPADLDLQAVRRSLGPSPTVPEARILVRPGAGHALRRLAAAVEYDVPGPAGARWDRLVIAPAWADIVEDVLAHGPDAVLEEPADLRREVVRRLREVAVSA